MARNGVKGFKADLNKFSRKVGVDIGLVVKKLAFDIFTGVVKKTPVDTGRARAAWNISAGKPDLSVPDAAQFKGSDGGGKRGPTFIPNIGTSGIFTKIFITNNLDYIEFLENGSSEQSPNGMVAVTLAESRSFLRKAIK